ncbi:hypothetical protein [Rhodospirillaceae bacterium SYSU D60014]|uniref:hypothetical protein n=1 Tax=Virgifigura deserti TaxID=2268457 RepID=UPI000E66D2B7
MFRDFIIFLVNLFVVEPFQEELNGRLAQVGAPQAVVSEVASCASTALPILVERVSSDPWWGTSTIFRIWIGNTTSAVVLGQTVPTCETAIETARPYLGDAAA